MNIGEQPSCSVDLRPAAVVADQVGRAKFVCEGGSIIRAEDKTRLARNASQFARREDRRLPYAWWVIPAVPIGLGMWIALWLTAWRFWSYLAL